MASNWRTVEDAAETVRRSIPTVNRWALGGDVRSGKDIYGRRLVFLPDVIEAAGKKRPGRPRKNVSNVIT